MAMAMDIAIITGFILYPSPIDNLYENLPKYNIKGVFCR